MPSEHPLLYTSDMVIRILTCAKCGKISIEFPCCHCGSEEFCKTQTCRVPVERYRNWKVSDLIWVRENWATFAFLDKKRPSKIHEGIPQPKIWYMADDDCYDVKYPSAAPSMNIGKTRPSIFMPKWATRIWLEITGLRDERVQDIGESGAVAEGVEHYEIAGLKGWKPYKYFTKNTVEYKAKRHSTVCTTARDSFIGLWDSINTKRGYGWDTNPEVKVIKFKRVQEYP